MSKMYVKAFNADLSGYGKYPFAVGETYETETKDTWNWFHYTDKLTTALAHYPYANVHFCEIEPLGKTRSFNGGNNGKYYTTNKIRIVRELEREEVWHLLLREKCPFWLIKYLAPPYEVLLQYKTKIRGDSCLAILKRDDLNAEQKKMLLPMNHHKYIELF